MPLSISSKPEPLQINVCDMRVQLKHKLTKTTKYKQDIRNRTGYCIQVVGDGYCLIEFDKIERVTKYGKKKLQWYVHENDFFIKL